MLLAIEIGGTKLQLGVGSGDGPPLVELVRETVEPARGAGAIREQIVRLARPLIEKHQVTAVGVGFGGPVDADAGRTITSHQVDGWADFSLAAWCRDAFRLPAAIGNDSDLAGLGEARFGAGRGHSIVFYSNVGSGIGGALVIDGQLYRGSAGVASEIGQMRPGPSAEQADATVESLASGWTIASGVRRYIAKFSPSDPDVADLLRRCGDDPEGLTAATVAAAATEGNWLAREAFDGVCRVYGWALAQVITLLAPNVVVVGGGVSLAGEDVFFAPLRRYVDRYVFPPLVGSVKIVPAALGEEVVLHGALAIVS